MSRLRIHLIAFEFSPSSMESDEVSKHRFNVDVRKGKEDQA